jgi:hypothetical protein
MAHDQLVNASLVEVGHWSRPDHSSMWLSRVRERVGWAVEPVTHRSPDHRSILLVRNLELGHPQPFVCEALLKALDVELQVPTDDLGIAGREHGTDLLPRHTLILELGGDLGRHAG